MPYAKMQSFLPEEQGNALLNALCEWAHRTKQAPPSEEEMEKMKADIPLLIRCLHDFGYHVEANKRDK